MKLNDDHFPANSISYETYFEMVKKLVEEGKTSGPNQVESLVDYTKLNFSRMKRLNKTSGLSEKLIKRVEEIPYKMKWVLITEAWCGDAAQNLPYIAKLAEACENTELELVFRDEHPEFMEHYLTNGGKSIPKLVVFNAETREEVAVWGPRPEPVQEMVMEYKKQDEGSKLPFDQFAEKLHAWYNQDKNNALESELLLLFKDIGELV
jgi:hypothetical protein